jgi:hypothetical protein
MVRSSDCEEILIVCRFSKIPFAAVTFCPDIKSYNEVFDYNKIVTALENRKMTIDNITSEQCVLQRFVTRLTITSLV